MPLFNPTNNSGGGGEPSDELLGSTGHIDVSADEPGFGSGTIVVRPLGGNTVGQIVFPTHFAMYGNVGEDGNGDWDSGIDFNGFGGANIMHPDNEILLNGTYLKDIPRDYIKLRSPDSSVWNLTVDNAGALSATEEV